jgi:hypothetical protein
MVGRLDVVCNRGVGKEAMGEEDDNGGRRSTKEPIPLTKPVMRHDDNDKNEMIKLFKKISRWWWYMTDRWGCGEQ